jgi:hypothetical protein
MARAPKKPKEGDLNFLGDVLPAIARKDNSWWDNLNEAQQREFNAWVYMRWLSNVEGPMQIYWLIGINQRVNKNFSVLKGSSHAGNHNRLLYQLMSSVSCEGRAPKVSWVPPCKGAKDKKEGVLLKLYPHYKFEDIEALSSIMTDDELLELMLEHGLADEEFEKL